LYGGSAIFLQPKGTGEVLRVVLDTNVLFAGLISPRGAAYQILSLVIHGDLTCAATPALWAEYEEQLSSGRFQALTPLSPQQVSDVLDYLASIVKPTRNDFTWRGILLDADDAIVAEAAFNAGAEALITFNVDHFQVLRGQVSFKIQSPSVFLKAWRRRRS
jgi:putative PIN family toxin of toxin-antitoxin system